ncbi:ATP-binding protein [Hymenobacter sp. YC55]|uniref:ATP-binding protein n=1 Tax=Hymenobacter sp. YC55 TaxID=3034019 RepID=UPI0023F7AB42|nr:ATP-binding protein [Hymenobacter sp. YC55]MDF7812856.1 ATP-binding protein [Hymenobacter sp. YC55]
MTKQIGKIIATEKSPSTVDEFYFWTVKDLILNPFDVVKINHLKGSTTFGVVEEISHITDGASYLAGFISSDFGDVTAKPNTERIGMNYIKTRVVGNSKGIYTPVLDGSSVSLADASDVKKALGLSDTKNPLPCGYIKMYEEDTLTIPVNLDANFIIGPEGAHLNISGISGLASKTSYAMFLLKAIQDKYEKGNNKDSVAFIVVNVKGRDLLALDEPNEELDEKDKADYELLNVGSSPFNNVKYYYPFDNNQGNSTYGKDFAGQKKLGKAFKYKYTFAEDKEKIDMLFSNIDDPNGTMESIVAHITSQSSEFANLQTWTDFKEKLAEYKQKGDTGKDKEISVLSWRKFSRHFNRVLEKSTIFNDNVVKDKKEVRLTEEIENISKNDVLVIDIAKLDEETQGFVFGDIVNAIYELKLGQLNDRSEEDLPSKIIVFIDELNKYASKESPKNSPILRRMLEITERGRSLGIILFGAEQFKSAIHDRVKGNCSTHAYGRTNAIEVSKSDYQYIPPVYKSMMTRLEQGEYIIQNPVFRSLLNIKFPKPVYKQFKNG